MQNLTLRETARRYRCSPGYLSERVREGKPVKGYPLHEHAVIEQGRVKEFRFEDSHKFPNSELIRRNPSSPLDSELIRPNPSSPPVLSPQSPIPALKTPTSDLTWLTEFARQGEASKVTGYVAASNALSNIANTANTAQTTQAKVFSSALGRALMLCGIVVAGGVITYNLAKHAESDTTKLLVGAVGAGGIFWLATKANESLDATERLAYSLPLLPRLKPIAPSANNKPPSLHTRIFEPQV